MASSIARLLGITATIAGLLLFLALREPFLGGILFIVGVVVLGLTLLKTRSEHVSKTSANPIETPLTENGFGLNVDDENLDTLASQGNLSDAGLGSSKLSMSTSTQGIQDSGKGAFLDPNKQQNEMKKQWWAFNTRQQMQKQSQDMFKQQREMAQRQQEELRRQQELRRRRQ